MIRKKAYKHKPCCRCPAARASSSKDEGRTWSNQRVIGGSAEDDYGYPSLLFLDGFAIISFHQRDGLHVARIPIDWFYE